jgi:UDPglucose 6-dehydrogenase
MRLSVIGTGYLGATHAACMAELGHDVIGVDSDPAKVSALNSGHVPFFEPGLPEVLQRNLAAGRVRFSTDPSAAAGADVHFVCVGTPQRASAYGADLSQVWAAVAALAPHLSEAALVVGKSTVPVGTAAEMTLRLQQSAPAGAEVHVAWNPEFLREGHAVADTLDPDRLVVGVTSAEDEARLRLVYAALLDKGIPWLAMDLPTAELVKVSANAFLATKISFINAMSEVCEATGADVVTLSEALGMDPRIGGQFLRAGLGFGGGCLPKDIRAFMARAGELGVDQALTFLREVDEINLRRRRRTVDLAREAVGGRFRDRNVAVWGAAFKPNSDDVRDSPALDVAAAIYTEGAEVIVHDPRAMDNARESFPHLRYADSPEEAVGDADAVLLLTEWRDYLDLDPELIRPLMRQPVVVDARNALDLGRWRAAGFSYRGLGRPGA